MRRVVAVALLAVAALVACGKASPRPGDVCSRLELGRASCLDPEHRLVCRYFTWQLDDCEGPLGCASDGRANAACDQTVAWVGSAGDVGGARSCTSDHRTMLRCDGTQRTPSLVCRGDRGCFQEPATGSVLCDQGGALAGDPCENAGVHCGLDGASVYECGSNHVYALRGRCRGARGCFRRAGAASEHVLCDTSVAELGDSCDTAGSIACSVDGKQENRCAGGTFALHRACPTGCSVRWDAAGQAFQAGCDDDGSDRISAAP